MTKVGAIKHDHSDGQSVRRWQRRGSIDTGKIHERLVNNGYALLNNDLCNKSLQKRVRRGIANLKAMDLPATFVLVLNQTWKLTSASHCLLLLSNGQSRGILKGEKMVFNFGVLAWNIDPRRNQAGLSPHQDRQLDTDQSLEESFYADEQAKYALHWITLSEASPGNLCAFM
ncbi:hypothetical protein ACHAWF_014745 [Thalassiosira exigua]